MSDPDITVHSFAEDPLVPDRCSACGRGEERHAYPAARLLYSALEELVDYVIQNTCLHEETHRVGAIWEICSECGKKWADDRGGKPIDAHEYPVPIRKALGALNAEPQRAHLRLEVPGSWPSLHPSHRLTAPDLFYGRLQWCRRCHVSVADYRVALDCPGRPRCPRPWPKNSAAELMSEVPADHPHLAQHRDTDRAISLLDRTRLEFGRQDEKWGWPRPVDYLDDDNGPLGEADLRASLSELGDAIEARARLLFERDRPCWQAIAAEEIGEAWREKDPGKRVVELIQAAATLLSHAQAIEEQAAGGDVPGDIRAEVESLHPGWKVARLIKGNGLIDLETQTAFPTAIVPCPALDGWIEIHERGERDD